MHDYVTWGTNLTRMMPRGFELILQFSLYGGCPYNRINALKSTFISMRDLHNGICLTSFLNWDLDVHLIEK